MVTIEFTYVYDSKYLPIYKEMFESKFTGRNWRKHGTSLSDHFLELDLKRVLLERSIDTSKLPIMVIKYNDVPVGLSFPKKTFDENEQELFLIHNNDGWFKIGSIVVLKEYHGKGIAFDACTLFMSQYNKIVYQVDETNLPSIKLAERLELAFSHSIKYNNINYKIYKSMETK